MGKTTCKTGNEKVAYFVFILHVVFGVVGLLLNVFSNLKKYHKQLAKGLLFLEAIMITILVVIWIILYENLDKTTQSKSEKC
jgi:H+/Cl- antiporter ClcA